jgi:hypothetical protein
MFVETRYPIPIFKLRPILQKVKEANKEDWIITYPPTEDICSNIPDNIVFRKE